MNLNKEPMYDPRDDLVFEWVNEIGDSNGKFFERKFITKEDMLKSDCFDSYIFDGSYYGTSERNI
ncbi:MAG: hypothetical protein K2P14_03570 [Anaeroplasmataceae bacterium]|nr:hypothetical protein [Anaeroplasmataceae bacterium]